MPVAGLLGNSVALARGSFSSFGMTYGTEYQLGTATPVTVYANLNATGDKASLSSSPLIPTLGPIQDLKINNQNGFLLQSTSANPRVTWSPPAVGHADMYYLVVSQLSISNGATTYTSPAGIFTTGTGLTIPPGLLLAGQKYFLTVHALSFPGVDLVQNPLAAEKIGSASSSVLSGMLTIQ